MLIDKQNLLADSQTLVGSFSATPVLCTNTIDLGAAGTVPFLGGSPSTDPGKGQPVELLIQVDTTVTSAGAATIKFQLITSAAANLGSPTVHESTEAIALATLVAGYRFRLGRSLPVGLTQRYLGVQYIIGTADTTAGTYTAALVCDSQSVSI